MSNLDITTLKEKLKNIPTPRPRTIDWYDEYPTNYEDATMRYSAPAKKVVNRCNNRYNKSENYAFELNFTNALKSYILQQKRAVSGLILTRRNHMQAPAIGTTFTHPPVFLIVLQSLLLIGIVKGWTI